MEHQTRRTTAAFAAVFFGLFASAGARAQPATEAGTAVDAAGVAAPQAAPPAPAPQVAPTPRAPAPQAAPPAAPAAPPSPAPPPPAWERQSLALQPAPARQPRPEYDGPPLAFGRRSAIGGYGGFSLGYTRMLNRDGALLGFEGALLVAHRLSLGLAGHGFSRSPQVPADWDGTAREFGTGYGGFVGRYAFFTRSPVYLSVGVLLGGGAAVLHESWGVNDGSSEDWDEDDHESAQGDGFFVVQPELSLHVNLTRWMRLGLTGGYRATSGVSRFGLGEGDLNGVVLGGNVQFGWI